MQNERDDQRSRDRTQNDRQRLLACAQHYGQVQAKAQQDDRPLENFFGGKLDAGGHTPLVLQRDSHQHPQQDRQDRPADHREAAAQPPGGQRKDQAQEYTAPIGSDELH